MFLVGKNGLIVMVPVLINKYVFEPSYNELKFTVQNCIIFIKPNIIFIKKETADYYINQHSLFLLCWRMTFSTLINFPACYSEKSLHLKPGKTGFKFCFTAI